MKTASRCSWSKLGALAWLALVVVLPARQTLRAATLTVNTTADPAGYNQNVTFATLGSTVTFRDAFNAVVNEGGAHTITFAPSLAGQTITLIQAGDGDSALATRYLGTYRQFDLTVQGLTGSPGVTIARSGPNDMRLFMCLDNTFQNSLTINDVTLADGRLPNGWGGIIQNVSSTLTLNRCTLTGGRAIFGGALYNNRLAHTTLNNCTLVNNVASSQGGAIYDDIGTLHLNFCTITGNSALQAAGLFVYAPPYPVLVNTIVASNHATISLPEIDGGVDASSHHNLTRSAGNEGPGIYNGAGGMVNGVNGNILGVDPGLGPLQNNGGPTPTLALLTSSQAARAGVGIAGIGTDQRGEARPQSGAADIGAFQLGANHLQTSLALSLPIQSAYGQSAVMTATASYSGAGLPLSGTVSLTVDGSNQTSAAVSNPASSTSGSATFYLPGNLAVGNHLVRAEFTPNSYYQPTIIWLSSRASGTLTVTQGVPTINFTRTVVPYTGFQQSAAGTVTGAFGETLGNPDFTYYPPGDTSLSNPLPGLPAAIGTYIIVAQFPATPNYVAVQRQGTFSIVDPAALGLVVTTLADVVNPADGVTSLREAVTNALVLGGERTITFTPSLFAGGAATSTISGFNNAISIRNATGKITIVGPGPELLTLSGNGMTPIFEAAGATVELSGLTLADGRGFFGGAYTLLGGSSLTVSNVAFLNNRSSGWGGAIQGYSPLTVIDCVFSNNTATYSGGALHLQGTLQVYGSTFLANRAGIDVSGQTNAFGTSLGGAIDSAFGSFKAVNSTFFGNQAANGQGGAISLHGYNQAVPLISGCTLVSNLADFSGGGLDVGENLNQVPRLYNSIVCGNVSPTNANVNLYTNAENPFLSSALVISNSLVDVGVMDIFATGLPANHGGPTPTLALNPAGPAINAGNNALIPAGTTTDQRGLARINTGTVDIGAYEFQFAPLAFTSQDQATFMVGLNGAFNVTLAGNPAPALLASGSLPAGVSLTPSGFLSGTPQPGTAGTYPLTLTASNGILASATQNFILYVHEAPSLIVSTTSDANNPLDELTSLREALAYAQSLGGAQTIAFAPALAGQTVTLSTGWNDASDAAALRVAGNITVQGLATAPGITLAVQSGVGKRHFFVEGSGNLTLSQLTLTGGAGPDYGGAVWSFGALTVRNCTFTGNQAGAEGGAIQSWGDSPLLLVENSTFTGNSSSGNASAIDAGAVSMTLRHVTITGNTAANADGALVLWKNQATLVNSIVAGNSDGSLGLVNGGSFSAQSVHNLIGTGGTGGLVNGVDGNLLGVAAVDLYLGPLAYNGGPTPTLALLSGSPAIDAGAWIPGISTDQRGFSRSVGLAPDIGAFEDSIAANPSLSRWRALQGLPANGSQDLANPSGDGVGNLLKYAFNLAPNAGDLLVSNRTTLPPGGTAGLPRITVDAQHRLVFQFVRRKAATNPGVGYVVEVSPDLSAWSELDLSGATVESVDANWERVTVTDPTAGAMRFGRVGVLYFGAYQNNFDSGLGAATLRGTAVYANQAVMLTDLVGGQLGAVVFDDITAGPANNGFTARFTMNLGPAGHVVPADGINFAVGDLGAGAWGETGPSTARHLAVGFDTYNNGGTGDIGIHIWANGAHVAASPVNPFTDGATVAVEISYDATSGVTVTFNGTTIFNNVPLPGFSLPSGSRFGIGARTGGAVERAVVDGVEIFTR